MTPDHSRICAIRIGFLTSAGYIWYDKNLMMKAMTKQEAQDFKQRWEFVNDFIAEEIRNTPPGIKLQQLITMFSTVRSRSHASSAEEQGVRDRWCLVKQRANV
jgi:hypothetical protein